MKNDIISNISKRLPIVLCLDISPSMRINKRIENLNWIVKRFFEELKSDPTVLNSVEVAVVTFSTYIEENTDFETIDFLENKIFSVVSEGDTNLSTAVLTSIKKIEDRVKELNDVEIDNYLPFLVLVTDSDPDQTDSQSNLEIAIQTVQQHSETSIDSKQLIVPYIIGVGEQIAEASLNRLAEKFTGKAIKINSNESHLQNLIIEWFRYIEDCNKRDADNLKSSYERIQKTATLQKNLPREYRKSLL